MKRQKAVSTDFKESSSGFAGVYVLEYEGTGICKIGITSDLEIRMNALQGATWNKINIVDFVFAFLPVGTAKMPDDFNTLKLSAYRLESLCHNQMKELDLHVRGEFFAIDAEDAKTVLVKVAEKNNIKLITPQQILKFDTLKIINGQEKRSYYALANAAGMAAEYMLKMREAA